MPVTGTRRFQFQTAHCEQKFLCRLFRALLQSVFKRQQFPEFLATFADGQFRLPCLEDGIGRDEASSRQHLFEHHGLVGVGRPFLFQQTCAKRFPRDASHIHFEITRKPPEIEIDMAFRCQPSFASEDPAEGGARRLVRAICACIEPNAGEFLYGPSFLCVGCIAGRLGRQKQRDHYFQRSGDIVDEALLLRPNQGAMIRVFHPVHPVVFGNGF
ncbi:hypothetical protein [Breoghania sp.]|uniref:hypothetical protein n=1 Tax=Breoghania sp. TaxID=2065378 RepID=UPI0026192E9A|nr:hypothetical protein [Breoghania sp.]MDJ0933383.1 hypothetical protein [Breoghania sp.]